MYELTVFGGAGAAGVLLAFLYDLFRLKRRIMKTTPMMTHVEDVLYWICSAIILFLSSYILSSGETRLYFYLGAFTGGLLYLGLFSKPILWLLSLLIKIIVWPFREIIKFLKPILHVFLLLVKRLLGKVKNRAAIEGYRARVGFYRIRNAFTKK
jgi:spore cortex biosynthesis protein YabQ